MTAVVEPEPHLNVLPTSFASFYSEVFDPQGAVRPAWKNYVEHIQSVSPEELKRRSLQAEQLLNENGVTFNVFQEGGQAPRPWSLDLLPVVIAAQDWNQVATGLRQRARLLNRIILDCYGPRELVRDGTLP